MENKVEFKTLELKGRRGITDLRGMLGDGANDWATEEELAKQREEASAHKAWNEAYVKELKEKGIYGEEFIQNIVHYVPFVAFGDKSTPQSESYRRDVFIINPETEKPIKPMITKEQIEFVGWIFKNKIEHVLIFQGMNTHHHMQVSMLFLPQNGHIIIYTNSDVKSVNLFVGDVESIEDLQTVMRLCKLELPSSAPENPIVENQQTPMV